MTIQSTERKGMLVILLIISLHAFYCISLSAQSDPSRLQRIEAAYPVIDQIFKDNAAKAHYPGFTYGLIVDGKLVHTGSTGYANLEKQIPAGTRSVFRIASMSKSFAAMAILKLRDEGKLRLDDPVYRYIPAMKKQPYLSADAPAVTIRHLLTHAAGFPEDNPWGDRQLADSDEELVQLIQSGISYSNAPGITYEYSNLGFAMLGLIIKKVSGKPYQQYIRDNIWRPLGMTHTYWEYTDVPADQLALGYRWLNDQWVEQPLEHDGSYGAMGGMITTIEDFSQYVALHLSAWPPGEEGGSKPIKKSSIREMHFPWNFSGLSSQSRTSDGRLCPTVGAYGYGLSWSKNCDGRVIIGHGGGLPGFGSHWRILPDYGIGIVSFSNLTYGGTGTVNLQVLDTLIAMAKLQPRPVPVSSVLNQRKNELVQLLPDWTNPQVTGIFADNFFLDYFPDQLRKDATAIFEKAGPIQRVGEMVAENNLRGSFVLEGEKARVWVYFTLTPETNPLIQEYRIRLLPK